MTFMCLGIQSKKLDTFTLLLQSIYRLKKACHGELDEECNLLTPDQVVDRIFELVDENGDGKTYYDSLFFLQLFNG